jgi:hypothetical protein
MQPPPPPLLFALLGITPRPLLLLRCGGGSGAEACMPARAKGLMPRLFPLLLCRSGSPLPSALAV